jgi:hypothetical protein
MNRRVLSRLVSAVFLVILLGAYVRLDYYIWNRRGRDAFIKSQENRFDSRIANPKPLPRILYMGSIYIAVAIGLYEGMGFTFFILFKDLFREPNRKAPVNRLTPL